MTTAIVHERPTVVRIGLRENLTPQRSNGLRSMVERIRTEANAALVTA